MAQLRQSKKAFDDQGVQVVLVGLGTAEQSEVFRKEQKVPFPIVCDPERQLYQAFELKRTRLRRLASPSLLVKGVRALSQGHAMGMPAGDVYQLPGVFIIDQDGRIRYAHYARDPADHPSPEDILSAVSSIGLSAGIS